MKKLIKLSIFCFAFIGILIFSSQNKTNAAISIPDDISIKIIDLNFINGEEDEMLSETSSEYIVAAGDTFRFDIPVYEGYVYMTAVVNVNDKLFLVNSSFIIPESHGISSYEIIRLYRPIDGNLTLLLYPNGTVAQASITEAIPAIPELNFPGFVYDDVIVIEETDGLRILQIKLKATAVYYSVQLPLDVTAEILVDGIFVSLPNSYQYKLGDVLRLTDETAVSWTINGMLREIGETVEFSVVGTMTVTKSLDTAFGTPTIQIGEAISGGTSGTQFSYGLSYVMPEGYVFVETGVLFRDLTITGDFDCEINSTYSSRIIAKRISERNEYSVGYTLQNAYGYQACAYLIYYTLVDGIKIYDIIYSTDILEYFTTKTIYIVMPSDYTGVIPRLHTWSSLGISSKFNTVWASAPETILVSGTTYKIEVKSIINMMIVQGFAGSRQIWKTADIAISGVYYDYTNNIWSNSAITASASQFFILCESLGWSSSQRGVPMQHGITAGNVVVSYFAIPADTGYQPVKIIGTSITWAGDGNVGVHAGWGQNQWHTVTFNTSTLKRTSLVLSS